MEHKGVTQQVLNEKMSTHTNIDILRTKVKTAVLTYNVHNIIYTQGNSVVVLGCQILGTKNRFTKDVSLELLMTDK